MGDVLWMRSIRVSDIFWLLWSYLFIYMSKLINEEMVFFFFLPSSFLVFVERKKGRVLSHVQESGAYGGTSFRQAAGNWGWLPDTFVRVKLSLFSSLLFNVFCMSYLLDS